MVETIPRRLVDNRVCMIQGHGAFAKARTIEEGLWLVCLTNHAGRVARMARKLDVDVDGLRRRIAAEPDAQFMFRPTNYTVNDDDVCEFPEE